MKGRKLFTRTKTRKILKASERKKGQDLEVKRARGGEKERKIISNVQRLCGGAVVSYRTAGQC